MDEAERRRQVVSALINNPSSFHAEARYQRVCAVCGSTDEWHAHHVFLKARLKKMRQPLHDIRAALRLCTTCHMSFEWGGVSRLRIKTSQLVDINICYLYELLGEAGEYFLVEKYTGPDERWESHPRGECPICQLQPTSP